MQTTDATGSKEAQAKAKKGAASGGSLPEHPAESQAATRAYVEELVAFLKLHDGKYQMSKVGIELKKPDGVPKIGRIMKQYPTWFRRSGDKGVPFSPCHRSQSAVAPEHTSAACLSVGLSLCYQPNERWPFRSGHMCSD